MATNLNEAIRISQEILAQYGSEVVSEKQQKNLNYLKIIGQNFIDRITKILKEQAQKQRQQYSLKRRIEAIGNFMHQSSFNTQNILQEAANFQHQLDTFLGRVIAITYVTDKGDINITTNVQAQQVYGKMGKGSGLTGKMFNGDKAIQGQLEGQLSQLQKKLDLQKLQNDINKAVMNRRSVYTVALSRFRKKNMDYKKEDEDNANPSTYWHLRSTGQQVGWQQIKNGGFIGQGYVNLIINTEDPGHELIFTRHPYNFEFEDQVEKLAKRAAEGDAVAGALIGDVVYLKDNGAIQLAVKQGWIFNAASIGPTVSIAEALVRIDNYGILKNLRVILEEKLTKMKQTNWESVFTALTGQVIDQLNNDNITSVVNLFQPS